MPDPFFALALGLCTQANSYQEKWGQAPLRSTLRDSIARASPCVMRFKNTPVASVKRVEFRDQAQPILLCWSPICENFDKEKPGETAGAKSDSFA